MTIYNFTTRVNSKTLNTLVLAPAAREVLNKNLQKKPVTTAVNINEHDIEMQ